MGFIVMINYPKKKWKIRKRDLKKEFCIIYSATNYVLLTINKRRIKQIRAPTFAILICLIIKQTGTLKKHSIKTYIV